MAALAQTISLVPGIELSPQEAIRCKNNFAVQGSMCKVLRKILKWECSDKQQGQTYADYFEQKKQQYEDRHTALVAEKNNRFKLPKIGLPPSAMEKLLEEPSKYDVTLMCSFLCELFKLKVSYTHIGHVRSLSQLECLLKEARDLRNAVMHEVAASAVDPMKFDEIVKAMHDVIDEAGNVYSIPADEVTSFKTKIDGLWDEVRTDNEKAKAYCRFFLHTFGKKEAKVMWEEMLSEETLLFGDDKVERSKVFYSLEMLVQKPNAQPKDKISYTELLCEDTKKFVVVIGVSGSGKSTLVKNLMIQFHKISDTEVEMINLRHHKVILYYECRNVSIAEFNDVVKENFEKVCQKLGHDTVIEGITELNPVVLVDGYDECHEDSYKVIEQIVNKMRNHECRVIITTRPSAAGKLKVFLKREGVAFQEYEISEISQLEDKKRFLEKYEKHVTPHTHEVVKRFCDLERNIQELFVHPIYLVLFCHLVWNDPESINNWRTHADVAHDIFLLYKKIIESKLASCTIVGLDGLIEDFFQSIGNFSLETLAENRLVFSENDVVHLKRNFTERLEAYGALGRLDPNALLGVVLKMKRLLRNSDSYTYFFHHKSIQELFAAKAVIEELRKNNCLLPALREGFKAIVSTQGVLTYVLMELCAENNYQVLKRNWDRMKEAANAALADKNFWQQILLSSPHSQLVAEETARVYKTHSDVWNIGSDLMLTLNAYFSDLMLTLNAYFSDLMLTLNAYFSDLMLTLNAYFSDLMLTLNAYFSDLMLTLNAYFSDLMLTLNAYFSDLMLTLNAYFSDLMLTLNAYFSDLMLTLNAYFSDLMLTLNAYFSDLMLTLNAYFSDLMLTLNAYFSDLMLTLNAYFSDLMLTLNAYFSDLMLTLNAYFSDLMLTLNAYFSDLMLTLNAYFSDLMLTLNAYFSDLMLTLNAYFSDLMLTLNAYFSDLMLTLNAYFSDLMLTLNAYFSDLMLTLNAYFSDLMLTLNVPSIITTIF
ncbi:uncharacterized protein LOC125178508 [Hyalella azteca]|uniref:Uncharacterized protein LOC125178508 n=1 Tax=Hyalella azteca TaxID=294128 RepID=A0A979FMS6_HYAAZ|nr:uncharacterized protein LOC125178508 [Hyalella azteca]